MFVSGAKEIDIVKLATSHRIKSRADVLLIKIPPAPPSQSAGHVFHSVVRAFPITIFVAQGYFFLGTMLR